MLSAVIPSIHHRHHHYHRVTAKTMGIMCRKLQDRSMADGTMDCFLEIQQHSILRLCRQNRGWVWLGVYMIISKLGLLLYLWARHRLLKVLCISRVSICEERKRTEEERKRKETWWETKYSTMECSLHTSPKQYWSLPWCYSSATNYCDHTCTNCSASLPLRK